jgi:hypothetical protein
LRLLIRLNLSGPLCPLRRCLLWGQILLLRPLRRCLLWGLILLLRPLRRLNLSGPLCPLRRLFLKVRFLLLHLLNRFVRWDRFLLLHLLNLLFLLILSDQIRHHLLPQFRLSALWGLLFLSFLLFRSDRILLYRLLHRLYRSVLQYPLHLSHPYRRSALSHRSVPLRRFDPSGRFLLLHLLNLFARWDRFLLLHPLNLYVLSDLLSLLRQFDLSDRRCRHHPLNR